MNDRDIEKWRIQQAERHLRDHFKRPSDTRPCPRCQRDVPVFILRRNTAYANDELNWTELCEDCYQEEEEYWQELWDDYYSSR